MIRTHSQGRLVADAFASLPLPRLPRESEPAHLIRQTEQDARVLRDGSLRLPGLRGKRWFFRGEEFGRLYPPAPAPLRLVYVAPNGGQPGTVHSLLLKRSA